MQSRQIPVTSKKPMIISLPVMKTTLLPVSPEYQTCRGRTATGEVYVAFLWFMAESININHLVKPDLIIIDGTVKQEDFGPISGTCKVRTCWSEELTRLQWMPLLVHYGL